MVSISCVKNLIIRAILSKLINLNVTLFMCYELTYNPLK